jgi:Fibronectin type III domain
MSRSTGRLSLSPSALARSIAGLSVIAIFAGSAAVSTPVGAQVTTTAGPTTTVASPFVSAPQLVQTTKVRDNEIRVSWLPPQQASQPVALYRIQILSNSADAIPGNSLVTVNGNTTSVNFRNLKLDRTYFFTVQAQTANALSEVSAPSAPITLINPASIVPNAVGNVIASQIGKDQALVTWSPPVARADVVIKGFRISTVPSSKRTDVGLVGQALISGLKSGVAYIVQVQAISTNNAFSAPASSAAFVVPPTVTQPIATIPPTLPATTTTTTTTLLPLPSPVEVPVLKAATRCTSRAWDPSLLGVPRQLSAGAQAGVYIWTDGRTIHLRTYNPTATPIRLSGSVSAKTSLPAKGFYLEAGADSLSVGRSTTSFSFLNAYDIDSLRFDGRCATKVTVRLFLNGQPIPPSQVFIGGNGFQPTSSAFVLSR